MQSPSSPDPSAICRQRADGVRRQNNNSQQSLLAQSNAGIRITYPLRYSPYWPRQTIQARQDRLVAIQPTSPECPTPLPSPTNRSKTMMSTLQSSLPAPYFCLFSCKFTSRNPNEAKEHLTRQHLQSTSHTNKNVWVQMVVNYQTRLAEHLTRSPRSLPPLNGNRQTRNAVLYIGCPMCSAIMQHYKIIEHQEKGEFEIKLINDLQTASQQRRHCHEHLFYKPYVCTRKLGSAGPAESAQQCNVEMTTLKEVGDHLKTVHLETDVARMTHAFLFRPFDELESLMAGNLIRREKLPPKRQLKKADEDGGSGDATPNKTLSLIVSKSTEDSDNSSPRRQRFAIEVGTGRSPTVRFQDEVEVLPLDDDDECVRKKEAIVQPDQSNLPPELVPMQITSSEDNRPTPVVNGEVKNGKELAIPKLLTKQTSASHPDASVIKDQRPATVDLEQEQQSPDSEDVTIINESHFIAQVMDQEDKASTSRPVFCLFCPQLMTSFKEALLHYSQHLDVYLECAACNQKFYDDKEMASSAFFTHANGQHAVVDGNLRNGEQFKVAKRWIRRFLTYQLSPEFESDAKQSGVEFCLACYKSMGCRQSPQPTDDQRRSQHLHQHLKYEVTFECRVCRLDSDVVCEFRFGQEDEASAHLKVHGINWNGDLSQAQCLFVKKNVIPKIEQLIDRCKKVCELIPGQRQE